MSKLRWKLYGLVTRSRRVCPANAHGALIWRTQPLTEILVDSTCRRDCAANGTCWCGNLTEENPVNAESEDRPSRRLGRSICPSTPLTANGAASAAATTS